MVDLPSVPEGSLNVLGGSHHRRITCGHLVSSAPHTPIISPAPLTPHLANTTINTERPVVHSSLTSKQIFVQLFNTDVPRMKYQGNNIPIALCLCHLYWALERIHRKIIYDIMNENGSSRTGLLSQLLLEDQSQQLETIHDPWWQFDDMFISVKKSPSWMSICGTGTQRRQKSVSPIHTYTNYKNSVKCIIKNVSFQKHWNVLMPIW